MLDGVVSLCMANKDKDKLDFKKRKFKTSPLSSLVPSLIFKIGGAAEAKKSASIIRIINHWPDIIGKDIASKTAPIKIIFKRQKNRDTNEQESVMALQLKAEGALGTTIAMRETIILDRLNRLFGHENFKKLDIIHGTVSSLQTPMTKKKPDITYDIQLPDIDDPILKSRLESLGQAVMNDTTNEQRTK